MRRAALWHLPHIEQIEALGPWPAAEPPPFAGSSSLPGPDGPPITVRAFSRQEDAFEYEKGARSEELDRRPKCHSLGGRRLP